MDKSSPTLRNNLVVAGLAFVLVAYPALLALKISGMQAIFSNFEGDTFYYLAVAKHQTWNPLFSYDSVFATNGFHPLWQWFLKCSFQFTALREHSEMQLAYAFLTSTLLIATASAIFANCVFKLTQNTWISLIAAVPGFLYWGLSALSPTYGAIWSLNNGMESPASLLFFSLFLHYALTKNILFSTQLFEYFVLSIFLTLIILARLDDIFLLPMLVLAIFFLNKKELGFGIQKVVCLSALPVFSVMIYLVVNYQYAGTAMPISGIEKNGFSLHTALGQTLDSVFPLLQIIMGKWESWDHLTLRAWQNAIPAVIAFVWIFHNKKNLSFEERFPDNSSMLLTCLVSYVLLKAGYNAFFVFLWHQGPWYYSISFQVVNMVIAVSLSRYIPVHLQASALAKTTVILLIMLTANSYVFQKQKNFFAPNYLLWSYREHIDEEILKDYKGKGILSFDDGILAYSLNRPVMSGFGFALDLEASNAKKNGLLFQLAYQRGFSLMGPNIGYALDFPSIVGTDVTEQVKKSNFAKGQNLDGWIFKVKYIDPITHFIFVEFLPNNAIIPS